MFIEPVVRQRHSALVPLAPLPGLVPGDQQDGLPRRVEGEQYADLASAPRAGTQLLHVAVPGLLHRAANGRPSAGPASRNSRTAAVTWAKLSPSSAASHSSTAGCVMISHRLPAILLRMHSSTQA